MKKESGPYNNMALWMEQTKRETMVAKLKLTDERDYFKPFNYPWAYDAWLKHEQSHWLHTEVPMAEDVNDWKDKLTDPEKAFLTNIFLSLIHISEPTRPY